MYQGISLRTIPMPGATCRDLAVDGRTLWVTSQGDARIYQIDIVTGAQIQYFGSPGANPGGIEVIHEHDWGNQDIVDAYGDGGDILLHTDWNTNTFYVLNKKTGGILRSFSLGGMVNLCTSIAHIGGTKVMVVGGGVEPQAVAIVDFKTGTMLKSATLGARRGAYFDGHYVISGSILNNNFKVLDLVPSIVTSITNPMTNVPQGCSGDGRTIYALDITLSLIHQIA